MDRSNGFEKKLLTQVFFTSNTSDHTYIQKFSSKASELCKFIVIKMERLRHWHKYRMTLIIQGVTKMAQEEEAYKWSTEDM